MRTALHVAWVALLMVGASSAVRELCSGTVRCEERCGAELWFAVFIAWVTLGVFGSRAIDHLSRGRRWR